MNLTLLQQSCSPADNETQFASGFFKLWASFTVEAGAKMAKSPIYYYYLPRVFSSLSKAPSVPESQLGSKVN